MISYKETLKNNQLTSYMPKHEHLLKRWYNSYYIQNRLIKYLYNREFCLLQGKLKGNSHLCLRGLRCHNTQSFQFFMNYLSMFSEPKKCYNMYSSMAGYKNGVPKRSFEGNTWEWDNEGWKQQSKKEIAAYDMLIDIDAGEFSEMDDAVYSAAMLKSQFDFFNVPYYGRYSGMGFHFIIPYRYFPEGLHLNPDEEGSIYPAMRSLAEHFYDTISEMIDTKIYDSRRICKIPYTASIYDEGVYICSPVSELEHFDYREHELTGNTDIIKLLENADILHNPNGSLKHYKRWLI